MTLTLTELEIEELTGYKQPAKQLAKLLSLGFFRARISRTGAVQLERVHYDAICAGAAAQTVKRPQLRNPALRRPATA
ncbi:hypothetical protein GCM10027082_23910 [Comamonas humi]